MYFKCEDFKSNRCFTFKTFSYAGISISVILFIINMFSGYVYDLKLKEGKTLSLKLRSQNVLLETPHFGNKSSVSELNLNETGYIGTWKLLSQGETIDNGLSQKRINIAVGLGITSKGLKKTKKTGTHVLKTTRSFIFFYQFLPTFCKTVNSGFIYNFFLAFDSNDNYFNNETNLNLFKEYFVSFVKLNCLNSSTYSIHFVETTHKGQPARAQNDAMMAAYMLNHQYYYRINDDTVLKTGNWTNRFIDSLKAFDPPNVGVVGPYHFGGNPSILTYDFVHFSHIDIHGFYYPREFTDWFADNWISNVYKPNRSLKVADIIILHSGSGSRYQYNKTTMRFLKPATDKGTYNIKRYLTYTKKNQGISVAADKVIVIYLLENDEKTLYGAMRNTQLVKLFFPSWKLRIYLLKTVKFSYIFLSKLHTLGADLAILNIPAAMTKVPTSLLHYLIIDHLKDIRYFLLRNAANVLTERDIEVTEQWLREKSFLFCTTERLSNILSGAILPELRKRLQSSIQSLLVKEIENNVTILKHQGILEKVLFPKFPLQIKCY